MGDQWEKTLTRYLPVVCKAIIKVMNDTIAEAMKEEITLPIAEKVDMKYSIRETESLTQKYHKGLKTGIDEVDNVRISIFFI